MATGGRYPAEVECIETIRKQSPNVGAYKLARQIKNRDVSSTVPCFRSVVAYRTVYSILSVIRRFDAKQQKKQAA